MAEEPPRLTSQKDYLGIFTLKMGKLSVLIFNERKLVLGTPDVKVKVKVKPPKSFGAGKYC